MALIWKMEGIFNKYDAAILSASLVSLEFENIY
jgi:hypothetical protein